MRGGPPGDSQRAGLENGVEAINQNIESGYEIEEIDEEVVRNDADDEEVHGYGIRLKENDGYGQVIVDQERNDERR